MAGGARPGRRFALFVLADGIAERAGRAVPDGAHDVVHAGAARGDEGLLAEVEGRGQAVGAESGVGAEAPVVEDGHPHPRVVVAPIGHPVGVFGIAETDAGVRPVTERFARGAAAAAQRHLRSHWHRSPSQFRRDARWSRGKGRRRTRESPRPARPGARAGVQGDSAPSGPPAGDSSSARRCRHAAASASPDVSGEPGMRARPQLGRRLGERPDRRLDGLSPGRSLC